MIFYLRQGDEKLEVQSFILLFVGIQTFQTYKVYLQWYTNEIYEIQAIYTDGKVSDIVDNQS